MTEKYWLFIESKERDGYEPTLIEFESIKKVEAWLSDIVKEGCYDGYNYKLIKGEEKQFNVNIKAVELEVF